MRGSDDQALATVVGAIIVIAILGMSVVYVNAYYVPRQGATLEIQTRSEAQSALLDMGTRMSGGPVPFVKDLPLKAGRSDPPLLDGIVLSPVRADGRIFFDPDAAKVKVSYNTTAAANCATDTNVCDGATRVSNPEGTMRVYSLGSASAGRALGSLNLTVGGAYLEEATYRLVGGSVFIARSSGDTLIAPPSLQLGQTGTITSVAWRIPILTGALGEVGGRDAAQVSLTPGPVARAGSGQLVYNATIEVQTTALGAWRDALLAVVDCATCTVVATPDAPGSDSGVVKAVIESTALNQALVSIDFSAVRYSLSLTERSAG